MGIVGLTRESHFLKASIKSSLISDRTFKALSSGALDLIQKPELDGDLANLLREKVRVLAGVKVIHRCKPKRHNTRSMVTPIGIRRIVAIVSSTGGPRVLPEILGALPRDYPACILVIQHLPRGFSTGFAEWLDNTLALEVLEVNGQETIRPGRILIAPDNQHLIIKSPSRVGLSDAPPVRGHRPAGSVLFSSLAKTCGEESIGIVLTGMGQDGADGLLDLHRAGGLCLAQDESTSLVFGMPKAAIELGKGVLEQVNVKGQDGWLLVVQAGMNACLTVSTTASAKLGLIFLDMKRAAEKIAEMI